MKTGKHGQDWLYLASASPRRRELLSQLGLRHRILAQDIDETTREGESAEDYVARMALEKARAALADADYDGSLPVLAADTTVVCDGAILGKPATLEAGVEMLGMLSGRQHQVLTAIALADAERSERALVASSVYFRRIDAAEMLAYWHSGEPRDKAGGYAIQGLGAMFVSRVEGSYSAVVGLPLYETMQLLAKFGITAQAVLEECSR